MSNVAYRHAPAEGFYEGFDFRSHAGTIHVTIRDCGDTTTITKSLPGAPVDKRCYICGVEDFERLDHLAAIAANPHLYARPRFVKSEVA